jgi:hypothetical protein
MESWNYTTLVWTEEYTTDIEICTWWDERAKKKPPHSLSCIRITCQPDGTGSGEFMLNGRSRTGLCKKDWAIVTERLHAVEAKGVVFESKAETLDWPRSAVFTFRLQNGEAFADKAILVARTLAQALGLTGQNLIDYVARFQSAQGTLVRSQGRWIGFADYLRHKHNLPSLLGTGWSDSR